MFVHVFPVFGAVFVMLCLKRSLSFLIAEDDEDDVILLQSMFSELDFRGGLRFVGNGQELLDYLRKNKSTPPDAIMLILLIDGFETLAAVQSHHDFENIPVILMSGSEPYFEMLKRQHRELDIEGVLFKPVTVEALVEVLKRYGCCTRPC